MQTFFYAGCKGNFARGIYELADLAFGLSHEGGQLEEQVLCRGQLGDDFGIWKRQLENRLTIIEIHTLAASQWSQFFTTLYLFRVERFIYL